MKNKKRKNGFTLIELLIVISVIGILSGVLLSAINVKGLRQKARDSQRVADLKRIQTALELYFTDNRSYPVPTLPATFVTASDSGSSSTLGSALVSGKYISQLPVDPSQGTAVFGACGTTTYGYTYRATATNYVLLVRMEIDENITSRCSSIPACASWSCNCGVGTYCYGVQNPL